IRHAQQAAQGTAIAAMAASVEQVKHASTQTVEQLGETSKKAVEKVDTAMEEFVRHSRELNETSKSIVKAMSAHLRRLDKAQTPSDALTARLEPQIGAAEAAAVALKERLGQDGALRAALEKETSALLATLTAASGAWRALA